MRLNFPYVKGSVCLSFGFILGAILLMLFSITGCSEAPLGSSMLTPDDIDRYTISSEGGALCIRDGFDSACMTLLPEDRNLIGIGKAPIIHIYPERLTYIFYREDDPILRAERLIDTTDILRGLRGTAAGGNGGEGGNGGSRGNNNGMTSNGNNGGEGGNGGSGGNNNGRNNNGNNAGEGGNGGSGGNNNGRDNNGNNAGINRNNNSSDATDGWIITIYYPDRSHLPAKLAHSGLTIRINEKEIGDEDIKDFSIFTNSDSEQGIRFVYPVGSSEFLGLRIEITGLANIQEIVWFDLEPPVGIP